MRVIVLNKDVILDGISHRAGDVVQVADGVKPEPVKLVDTFDESCIRKVLVGKPLEKAKVIKEEIAKPK